MSDDAADIDDRFPAVARVLEQDGARAPTRLLLGLTGGTVICALALSLPLVPAYRATCDVAPAPMPRTTQEPGCGEQAPLYVLARFAAAATAQVGTEATVDVLDAATLATTRATARTDGRQDASGATVLRACLPLGDEFARPVPLCARVRNGYESFAVRIVGGSGDPTN
jgi:hypothetical protein